MKLLSGKWLLNASQKSNTLEAVKRQEGVCWQHTEVSASMLRRRNALDDTHGGKKKNLAYCVHLPFGSMAKREKKAKALVCF